MQEIVKRKDGSYYVRGKSARDFILIPKYIEHPEQVAAALESIQPLTTKSKGHNQVQTTAYVGLATLATMVCVFALENKWLVGTALVLYLALTTWNFIQVQRSKNVDYRTKRSRWFTLLATLAILYFALMKLTDWQLF